MTQEAENPGPLAAFETAHPELSQEQSLKLWEKRLDEYRGTLAGVVGITVEDLHGVASQELIIPSPVARVVTV